MRAVKKRSMGREKRTSAGALFLLVFSRNKPAVCLIPPPKIGQWCAIKPLLIHGVTVVKTATDDSIDIDGITNIIQQVAVQHDQIGQLPYLNGPKILLDTDDARAVDGGSSKNLNWVIPPMANDHISQW